MADSTTGLDQIDVDTAEIERTVNELFDAASPAMGFGRHGSACVALHWEIYEGVIEISGTPTKIASTGFDLTDDATNYLRINADGTFTVTTSAPSGWPGALAAGARALYAIYCADGAAPTWDDWRLASGAPGAAGAQGATGTAGAQGATGTAGAQGAAGSAGAQGAGGAGAQGAAGAAGAQGAQGASALTQNAKSAAYTTVLGDANNVIEHDESDSTARIFTIDSNANVAYALGTYLFFANPHGAGTVTVAITSDTAYLAGSGSTGSRTLLADGFATYYKYASTKWLCWGSNFS